MGMNDSGSERCVSELGRLDVLINSAGMMLLGPVLGAPLDEWERTVAVNDPTNRAAGLSDGVD